LDKSNLCFIIKIMHMETKMFEIKINEGDIDIITKEIIPPIIRDVISLTIILIKNRKYLDQKTVKSEYEQIIKNLYHDIEFEHRFLKIKKTRYENYRRFNFIKDKAQFYSFLIHLGFKIIDLISLEMICELFADAINKKSFSKEKLISDITTSVGFGNKSFFVNLIDFDHDCQPIITIFLSQIKV
jgi:hypothetical protein